MEMHTKSNEYEIPQEEYRAKSTKSLISTVR